MEVKFYQRQGIIPSLPCSIIVYSLSNLYFCGLGESAIYRPISALEAQSRSDPGRMPIPTTPKVEIARAAVSPDE